MNSYPLWWDTAVTVYNRLEDTQTQIVRWYRSVLPHCFWKYVGDKVSNGQTVSETYNVICRIPENEVFCEKYKWLQMSDDEISSFFTLSIGDIIVKGECTDDIDEYKSGERSSDLIAKYKNLQGVMRIEQISINTGAGRCNPHYCVKGR